MTNHTDRFIATAAARIVTEIVDTMADGMSHEAAVADVKSRSIAGPVVWALVNKHQQQAELKDAMTPTLTQRNAVVTTSEARHLAADVLEFQPELARHINWDSIATKARELGAHFEVRFNDHGACTITMFWTYTE